MNKDINFEYIEEFVDYVIDEVENNEDAFVTVIAKFDEAKEILKNLMLYGNVNFDFLEIEAPITVAHVGRVDEFVTLVTHPIEGVEGLHIATVALREEPLDEGTRGGGVAVEVHLVLLAVENLDVDKFAVGAPCDVGQVALLVEIVHLNPHGLLGCGVVDPERDALRGETVLGVLYVYKRARTGCNVEQGKIGHAALVLAVEGNRKAIGRGECTTVDAKLVATNVGAVDDVGVGVGGYGLAKVANLHIKVVALGEVARGVVGSGGCVFGGLVGAHVKPLWLPGLLGDDAIEGVTLGIGAPECSDVVGNQFARENSLFHSQKSALWLLCHGVECQQKGRQSDI